MKCSNETEKIGSNVRMQRLNFQNIAKTILFNGVRPIPM